MVVKVLLCMTKEYWLHDKTSKLQNKNTCVLRWNERCESPGHSDEYLIDSFLDQYTSNSSR